ncbi:monooxygenase [Penicillium atrosanguineum]|nr:monooxygenase [Penicillium atrosanguineum]
MSVTEEWETTDILICGCGPTGAMLSGYLGKLGVRNIVLEKEAAITTDPRGIALDDDAIRLMQGLGLLAKGSIHKRNSPRSTHETFSLHGHIFEDADWVYATYSDASGTERKLRAKFLAAADGKTGFTRKMYLEPKGIQLNWAEQTKYEETWVALNWKLHLPTKETHPSFPLWELGYTPEEVYNLFFPADFRFLCNPERPAVCGRFGRPEDRLWRFEFVVASEEDDMEMATRKKVREVVYPYLTYPGSRYGLKEDIEFPEDCIESGGQGIASGFRDANALAWRLAIACSSLRIDYESLFKGWYLERKQQLDASLASTIRNGDMVNGTGLKHTFIRNWALWLIQLIPSWKHFLERGPRSSGAIQYSYLPEMPFMPELSGGSCFPQTYCMALHKDAAVQFTDDVIFEGKTSLFQIVVLLNNVEELASAVHDLKALNEGNELLSLRDATFFVPRTSCKPDTDYGSRQSVCRTATGDEFASSILCDSRPIPRGYDEMLMWKSVNGKRYVVLRPDRFVFAACNTEAELGKAATRLAQLFDI